MTPKIFAGSSNHNLAYAISQKSKIPLGKIDLGTFADGERDVWIAEEVNNDNVFILQSNSQPVNDHIIELTLIVDALRRAGAHRITAVIPYFGYARKEKQSRNGEPISAKVIADLIVGSGVNKVICLDLHADAIVGFFNVPVIHLSALAVFAKRLQNEKLKRPVVVAPDVGGVRRARNFAAILNSPLAVIEKHRQVNTRDKMEVLSVSGELSKETAVLIDDIISTGETIAESAQLLKKEGVAKIIVCATHGVFVSSALERLAKSPIDQIFVTDSIKSEVKNSKLEIVTIADLIANCLTSELA